jgi:Zn-dependent protease with chaperone function
MDFFAAQAAARRRTAVLVAWFGLAWLGTIALVWGALGLLAASGLLGLEVQVAALGPGFFAAVAAGVTLVTAGGSAFHAVRLARDGPDAVAAMVGGVRVERTSAEPGERRLVNVVEEMAIASGLPVPALYVLPGEEGINAFAAGFTPDRALVAVTRGALERLTRDELQGVVAHELSHLLNADAKLNLRLVALIGGITVLALAGRTLARGLSDAERDLDLPRGVRGRGGRIRFAVVATGLALWAAGAIGAFFGRVIRAAVSREREFLADAAAVQFTRNPDGLAGALAKIAQHGSALSSAGAPEVSHFFFANGLRSTWLATHPPISERLLRIAPGFAGRAARAAVAEALAESRRRGPSADDALSAARADALAELASAHTLVASAGRAEPSHVARASALLASLPPEVAAAARLPQGARAVVGALLVDADPAAAELQLRALEPAARAAIAPLAAALAGAGRGDRMAVLDLALPALDVLPPGDRAALARELAALAAADGRTSVFEWAVQRIVDRRLAPRAASRGGARARAVGDVQVETLELLSVLAWLGARDEAGAQAAVDAAASALGVRERWRPLPRDRVRAARLDAALARLDGASPALKAAILEACATCVLADGVVRPAEGEIVRAIAASLGVPVPPLVPAAGGAAAGAGAA